MAVTWDRRTIAWFWTGEDPPDLDPADDAAGWYVDPVDGEERHRFSGTEDEPVGLLLNLRRTGADDDHVEVLTSVLEQLNHGVSEHDGTSHDDWASGWVCVAQPGVESIALQNRTDFVCPSAYLDELCRVLTARGWAAHLTLPPLVLSHLGGPMGSEPTITTVVGYGVREVPSGASWSRGQRSFLPLWRADRELAAHVAETVVAWLEAAPGTTVCGDSTTWTPTPAQARTHVAQRLVGGNAPNLERLLVRDRREGEGGATRTGRVAFANQGSAILVDFDPERPLADRLADHAQVVSGQEHRVRHAFTTGTVGFTHRRASDVHRLREHLLPHVPHAAGVDAVPFQLPAHSPGLPDAYYSQLLPVDWLDRAHDLSRWQVEAREHDLAILTAADPEPWFRARVDPRRSDDEARHVRHVHDADADTLRQARADLGDLLQRPLSG